jgi:hypothetical protein
MSDYYLSKSKAKHKKYSIKFINSDTGRQNTINFGDNRYEDMTTHGDKYRKLAYERRHENEDWDNLKMAGAWSKHLLWHKKSLNESIKDMEKKFNIKIFY